MLVGAPALLVVAGCSDHEAGGTTLPARFVPSAPPPIIATPDEPYRPVQVDADGWVGGTVRIVGEVPPDTVIHPTMDQRVCGRELTDNSMVVRDGLLGGAVVWLTDIRSGRPLPATRRYEVTNARCRLEPRVQAVAAGGTLNVRNSDPIPQRTMIRRHHDGQSLALVEQTDFGQVVPDDRVLSEPGLLELTSELHPWTRGWVAVFDHPYFAVTDARGAFVLEGVPPGRYTLAAWHERFGRIEREVIVVAGQRVTMELEFGVPGIRLEGGGEGVVDEEQ